MAVYPIPENDDERVEYLRKTHLLDTPEEDVFNAIVGLAKSHFNVPIAIINLIDKDRQWFKAKCGVTLTETSRDDSMCTHTIMDEFVTIIPDASKDSRFEHNRYVINAPNIRFYAGAPIIMPAGIIIGTLCLVDDKANNEFDPQQANELAEMALIVAHIIELSMLANA
ncbi:MAG: GAF domain-containing protein [Alphaproteobacteria bacterium]|nr:GAF domain-containing protein [Alphaproteobacteria bacterium]